MRHLRNSVLIGLIVVLAASFVRDEAEHLAPAPVGAARLLLLPAPERIDMPLLTIRVRQVANT
ncbi:MAG: hypothetical protein JOZ62_18805, partial [Acidobacteriaceae bacterium]|nr:hypothetical protein [Acidobacteriaceae bacterium]